MFLERRLDYQMEILPYIENRVYRSVCVVDIIVLYPVNGIKYVIRTYTHRWYSRSIFLSRSTALRSRALYFNQWCMSR